MKVSINEILKDRVFVFLPIESTVDELNSFKEKVTNWMSQKYNEVPYIFQMPTSDGSIVICAVIDVNAKLESPQFNENW